MSDNAEAANSTPTADTGRAGIILAGGRSKRFPTVDKALAPLDGTPLLWYAADSLAPVVDELLVSCRREQREPFAEALDGFDVRFVVDNIPDRGPLEGLRTALSATTATYAAVVPCDMPAIPAGFLEFLCARGRNKTGAVAAFEGRRQPLPAVFHVRAAQAACRAVDTRGEKQLERLLDELDAHVVDERTVRAHVKSAAFHNINTPADLAAARESL